jgi:transposase
LLGDKGYDAAWCRHAARSTTAASQEKPIEQDRKLYRQRHKVENMFESAKSGGASTSATASAAIPSCPQSHRSHRRLLDLIYES